MNEQSIEMLGKRIQIDISKRAEKQLEKHVGPLFIEMELYFSCLLRKQLRVYETEREKLEEEFSARLSDNLEISFRPVMTKS